MSELTIGFLMKAFEDSVDFPEDGAQEECVCERGCRTVKDLDEEERRKMMKFIQELDDEELDADIILSPFPSWLI